jgi:hypothetical protein
LNPLPGALSEVGDEGLEALRRSDFELLGVHPFLRPFDTIPHRLLHHEPLHDELGSLFMLSAITGCVRRIAFWGFCSNLA